MKLIGILIVVREIISLHQKVKKIFLDKPLLRNLWKKLLLERLAILNFLSRVLEYFVAPLSTAANLVSLRARSAYISGKGEIISYIGISECFGALSYLYY